MESDVLYAVKPARARRVAPVSRAILGRALDLTLALLLLVILAPLMAVIALAIRLDSPGSPIFRQRRLGRRERPFTVNKFRTMRAASDSEPHRAYIRELIAHGAGAARQDGAGKPLFKLAVDDRVTRTGRFLRRWSLDELPQLWNVVRGDMSLVGPRPVIAYEAELYPDWYRERFAVKPGLTGLWQVSGRNERTYEEMAHLDVEYARRQSLRLDLTILLKTIWIVLSRKGVA
ncbi:MAG: sugar transferase [Actinomycetota bacterium]|nr:sugar transferase [Actinomycetota bacterium]